MPRPTMRRHPEPEVPSEDDTKDEIVRHLRARGVDVTTRMTKAELLELVE